MTTNYHTALTAADNANAETFNSVLRQLDQQMTDMDDGTHNFSAIDIDGGAIDSTVIGGSTAATGAFTTLTVTGNLTVGSSWKVDLAQIQLVLTGTTVNVKWNYVVLDSNGDFTIGSTYRITPSVAGYYLTGAVITQTAGAAGKSHTVTIRKSASGVAIAQNDMKRGFLETLSCVTLISLNGTTDYVDVQVFNGSAGTVNLNTDDTYFWGMKVY